MISLYILDLVEFFFGSVVGGNFLETFHKLFGVGVALIALQGFQDVLVAVEGESSQKLEVGLLSESDKQPHVVLAAVFPHPRADLFLFEAGG